MKSGHSTDDDFNGFNTDDDGYHQPDITANPQDREKTNFHVPNGKKSEAKCRLKPKEIYAAAIGMFEKRKFKLLHIAPNKKNDNQPEAARVYQKVEGGRLYIIYSPSTETNSKINNQLNTTETLQDIIAVADKGLAYTQVSILNNGDPIPKIEGVLYLVVNGEKITVHTQYETESRELTSEQIATLTNTGIPLDGTRITKTDAKSVAAITSICNCTHGLHDAFSSRQLRDAKKIFIVSENSTYFGFHVSHYIKADLTNDVLTTVDSIDRNYDETHITNVIPHTERQAIKTGHQSMFNDWECGHHTLAAIGWDLDGEDIPAEYAIIEDVVTQNFNYYKAGLASDTLQKNTHSKHKDFTADDTDENDTPPINIDSDDEIFLPMPNQQKKIKEKHEITHNLNFDDFIEITPAEQETIPAMSQLVETGRHSKNTESVSKNEKHEFFRAEMQRDKTVKVDRKSKFTENEIDAIADVHLQDLFTAPIDLINKGNPTLIATATENATLRIYKKEDNTFADCVVDSINLQTNPLVKPVTIPGKILFRYIWDSGKNNWNIHYTGTTDIRLKKLLSAQYPVFDKAREIDISRMKVENKKQNPINKEESNKLKQIDNQLNALIPATQLFIENLAAEVMIPISGKVGHLADDCYLSVTQFKNSLRHFSQDPNLDITTVPSLNTDAIILRVYPNKKATSSKIKDLFGNTNPMQDNNGNAYYDLTINQQHKKQLNTQTTQPLFGMNACINKGLYTTIDVTRIFSTAEIKHFKAQASEKLKSNNGLISTIGAINSKDNILENIKSVNHYLSQRAKETSGLWHKVRGTFSGEDYYGRRASWKKILKEMNEPTLTIASLKKLITAEANKFKRYSFDFLKIQRNDYYDKLIALRDSIPNDYDFSGIRPRVATYYQIYDEMDQYRYATQSYMNQRSIFSSNKQLKSKVEFERELYDSHYKMLDTEDRKDFLNMADEKTAEKENIKRYFS